MPARWLDGKVLAAAILARIQGKPRARPGELACLWMGEDPSAASYRRGLAKACAAAGVRFHERGLPAVAGPEALMAELDALNRDPAISGILIQMPLPAALASERVFAAIDPRKDAEGMGPASLGLALKGDAAHAPATARAAFALVLASGMELKGAEAVVVGASDVVGKPVAMLLSQARATVTLCRSAPRDLAGHVRRADILVAAVGKPGFVTGDMVKPGAVVVDVGINAVPGPDGKTRIVGDVEFASASERAGWITPVPGGVGPVTSAMIVERAAQSALAPR